MFSKEILASCLRRTQLEGYIDKLLFLGGTIGGREEECQKLYGIKINDRDKGKT